MLLKACINGVRPSTDHPALSGEPWQVAAEAAAAVRAGADAIHVHAKDDRGQDSLRDGDVTRFVEAVRAACPGTPVGVTTGAWAVPDVVERVAAVASWTCRPDFASVNWHEEGADEVARALLARGVGVEAGIWGVEGLRRWQRSGLHDECLRALIELPDMDEDDVATRVGDMGRRLLTGIRATAPALPVLLHGEERSTWPALDVAAGLGLDARIGLEDTLLLPDGTTARDNADLVTAAVARLDATR